MKKIFPEVIWIFVLAGLLGIVNNLFSDKPLSMIPKPEKTNIAPDSLLTLGKSGKAIKEPFDVTYEQIKGFLDDPNVIFIDARSPDQFEAGHIGKAINIFPLMEDTEQYLMQVNAIPRDKILIIYCDGGTCDLSHELSKTLIEFGYNQIFLYKGGWEEWVAKKK